MDDRGASSPGDDQNPPPAQGTPPLTGWSGSEARPPLRVHTIATGYNAAQLRQQFHDWLALDTAADIVADLVLAVYEAVANTVEHAYTDHPDGLGPLRLQAHRTDGQVLITISDEGTWRAPTSDRFAAAGCR